MLKLKKIMSVILISTLILTVSPFAVSAADLTLKIDGKVVTSDVAPLIKDGRTLVPIRIIAETLGADVDWNPSKQEVVITTAANKIMFTIGSKNYTVNGAGKTLDVAAEIISSRTMVPLRAVSEAIGAQINFDEKTTTVTVNYFTAMSGSVKITGSTTVQPIAQAAADKLNGMNSGLTISVAGGGSGAGVNDTIAGTNNLGMSSRELTKEEAEQINDIVIANDGIAIIVNPENPVKNLSSDQAAKIFLGEIKNWKDVGGNDAPILVQTRETGSGTRTTFEELLLSKTLVVETATPHTSSELIKQAVAREKNAVGFDSIGFVDSTVKTVSLDNIAPTAETVKSGSYKMGRSLFMLTNGAPTGVSGMFIDYLKTLDCQDNIVVKEGYISIY
jgi:phosphate transport system substrate-binding protein